MLRNVKGIIPKTRRELGPSLAGIVDKEVEALKGKSSDDLFASLSKKNDQLETVAKMHSKSKSPYEANAHHVTYSMHYQHTTQVHGMLQGHLQNQALMAKLNQNQNQNQNSNQIKR